MAIKSVGENRGEMGRSSLIVATCINISLTLTLTGWQRCTIIGGIGNLARSGPSAVSEIDTLPITKS